MLITAVDVTFRIYYLVAEIYLPVLCKTAHNYPKSWTRVDVYIFGAFTCWESKLL